MGKFQFLEAAKICAVPQPGSIKSPGCLACLETYRANMLTAVVATTLPAFAFWMGMEWTKSCTMASISVVGINATDAQKGAEANRIGSLAEVYMRHAMPHARDEQLAHLKAKTESFERFSTYAGPVAEEVIQNLLRGIVIQSWTAFETLAEELYLCAQQETKIKLPLPLDRKGNPMQPGFRSRSKIRQAYAAGFSVDGDKVNNPLADSAINALALLRNVIVHKATKADMDFREGVGRTPLLSVYSHLNDGDAVVLDGKIVRSIVSPVIQRAYSVISAVNIWLTKH